MYYIISRLQFCWIHFEWKDLVVEYKFRFLVINENIELIYFMERFVSLVLENFQWIYELFLRWLNCHIVG